ncbi:unnamed protein product, partial [Allacma fusca]
PGYDQPVFVFTCKEVPEGTDLGNEFGGLEKHNDLPKDIVILGKRNRCMTIKMRKSILIPPIPEPDDLRLTRTTQAALDKEFKDTGKAYGRYNRVNLPTKAYLQLRDLAAQAPLQDIAGSNDEPSGSDFQSQECHAIVDDAVRLGDTADVLSCDSTDELAHPNASSTAETVQSSRDPVIPGTH